MKICGIIAEYNPFHNGHTYQIEQTKLKTGSTHVIAVMSGNYTQRGEPAFVRKHLRAEAALKNGVDLVVELPTVWAAARAESFARAGISILNSLGCVDFLSFGSESGDLEAISKIANFLDTEYFQITLSKYLSQGMTFAKARFLTIGDLLGPDFGDIISSANNTLGVEYIKSLKYYSSNIKPFTIKRIGANHDSKEIVDNFASASYIREQSTLKGLIPDNTLMLYPENERIIRDKYETAVLAQLRRLSKSDISSLPDISEGLENRIYTAIRQYNSLDEITTQIKTKRYSHARIRRILLSAFLGITNEDTKSEPPYIRVLGFNKKGIEILKCASNKATKPIYVRSAELIKNGGRIFEIECLSTDLYSMCKGIATNCSSELTTSPVSL